MSGRRPASRHTGGEDGFTLVEVLVAFAMVSLVCVMVLRVAADMVSGGRRIGAAEIRLDEAEGIVLTRAANGSLRAGLEQGRFGDGRSWALSVVDVGPAIGWANLPPLWRIQLTLDGPGGPVIYTTLIAGGIGGS